MEGKTMLTMAGNLTHREEQTVECLEVRNAAYQLLVDFIGEEPTLENIVAWRNHSIWGQLSSMSEGAREVCKRLQEVPLLELYNLLSSMRVEYERLFLPGGERPVTPCESMYRAHEQMLPKSYAQEVREDYAD
ncbi:anaerobic dehydrogenase, partial [Clostridium perfringens]|nr:anaerobic dehydrogenase [Clostridium perfringens]